MPSTIDILKSLIEEGEHFSYNNFGCHFDGYPQTFSKKWITWRTRTETFVKSKFGKDSVPYQILKKGLNQHLLGFDYMNFDNAKALILGALNSALLSIDDDALYEVGLPEVSQTGRNISNKVFVVHGHNEKAKNELEIFLKEIGLEPVVLHRQPDEGQTIIEKFEKHSDVGYAFILLTPDEIAYTVDQESLEDDTRKKESRSRPNVIFEFGYFVGKLGRNKVCCLHTGDITLPSDLDGLLYKKFNQNLEETKYNIMKELKAVGYKIKV